MSEEQQQQKTLAPKRECGLHSSGKRVNFARKIVHELVGWQPYERHTMDLIKIERRRAARQFLKKRLGTHRRAMKKLNTLEEVVQEESLHHHHE
ncbi:ribosomal protein L36e, putative [Trichomonas vaginalis G3]|uniref:Ribosomal protein L36e, putative n=1 Tax=Trichomonas vaginalis (strain ATCC PRA-98 / G3) TaxID=412133 RepID=A2DIW6_TRIV3|nr:cytoplasmic translation [Trichomonas vaginalis G3]EAY19729.1 ribosomal protein L36e, putative [Trichomonas vaginalis G3]KAI5521251.1 cytoplasmic translation [Trichomonas vaginalis G3]|eukprot:XP_001580715.1 ribosomal protein L36e [Trichomonas vaginalis G3]